MVAAMERHVFVVWHPTQMEDCFGMMMVSFDLWCADATAMAACTNTPPVPDFGEVALHLLDTGLRDGLQDLRDLQRDTFCNDSPCRINDRA